MMKNLIGTITIVIFVLGGISCNPSVNTDKAEDVNLKNYSTFAYLPSGDSVQNRVVMEERVIAEVRQEMEGRGYKLDADNPDLVVLVKAMYEEEERLRREPYYTSYDYYSPRFYSPTTLSPYYYRGYATIPRVTGYNIREIEYTEGTFVVDVIDRENNRIVWRGWSSTSVDPMNLETSIREYVDNIYDEYPIESNQ
jgi:hypothetical protein